MTTVIRRLMLLPIALTFFGAHHMAFAALRIINRTIDDTYGDEITGIVPSYSNGSVWNQGNTCMGCHVNRTIVDVEEAYDQTWKDSTYHVGDLEHVISMSFTGTAVYAFTLLANKIIWTTTFTNVTFHIDGEDSGIFTHWPDNTTNILYNVSMFSRTGLPNKAHQFEIRMGGETDSLLLFDYVVYTSEEVEKSPVTNTTASSTSSSLIFPSPLSPISASVTRGTSLFTRPLTHSNAFTTPPISSQIATSHVTLKSPSTTSSTDARPMEHSSSLTTEPPTHEPHKIGPVVGGVLGGLALVAGAAVVTLSIHCRCRQTSPPQPSVTPFNSLLPSPSRHNLSATCE